MADFDVATANMALDLIGEDDQINAPSDDKHTARTIAAVWDQVRRAAIRDLAPTFARRRRSLAAVSDGEVNYPWTYRHQLPADKLKLVEVLNLSRGDYEIDGDCLLCNSLGPIYVRILVDVPVAASWDALFTEQMACRLALQTGTRIAGSNFDTGKVERHLKRIMGRAVQADGTENPPVEPHLTGWEEAHLGYAPSGLG